MSNPFTVSVPEALYPVPIMRQSFTPPLQIVTPNGTSAAVIGVDQYISLFQTGSKGEVIDFARFRFETVAPDSTTGILRYVPSGTVPNGSGTAISSSSAAFTSTAHTNYSFTIDPLNNRVPANSLVYLAFNQAVTGSGGTVGLSGLTLDIGRRAFTN
jgi:hypothetical protein